MKAVFLASGRSQRTAPISDKTLLKFCGEPLFWILMQNALEAGVTEFVVVTNPENHKPIEQYLKEKGVSAQVTLQKNLDEDQAGGIRDGLELVDDDEPVLILGGNDFVPAAAYARTMEVGKTADGAILAKRMEQYFPGGYVQMGENNRIENIIEKPGEGNEPSNLVNIVVHYFGRAGDIKVCLGGMTPKEGNMYEASLQKLFEKKNFLAVEHTGVWQPIKYPWHILDMMELLLSQQETNISKEAEISPHAIIEDEGVVIEAGVRVLAGAIIQGPCFIGANSMIGTGSLTRNSMIGANGSIGFNSEVARSYIGDDSSTHIAYVGDSVAGAGVNFGGFSCTTNFRLDKKTVRMDIKGEKIDSHHQKLGCFVGDGAQIGSHVCLMPGAKVPANEFILPNTMWK